MLMFQVFTIHVHLRIRVVLTGIAFLGAQNLMIKRPSFKWILDIQPVFVESQRKDEVLISQSCNIPLFSGCNCQMIVLTGLPYSNMKRERYIDILGFYMTSQMSTLNQDLVIRVNNLVPRLAKRKEPGNEVAE